MRILLFCSLVLASLDGFTQTFSLTGKVTDANNGEPLIGATVVVGTTGTTTDFDGNYALDLPKGSHAVSFSYVAYEPLHRQVELTQNMILNVELSTTMLDEVVVVADIAKERETPVAFSNIPSLRIKEELSSRDLVMVLNSTPGAYATQSGGGDGDARVTIRGFNQRNVAVMVDGIPVNDMENGWVYWSNWFGLDLVTQSMQVQRGLGASKISLPSVGGTINILTKGIDAKRDLSVRQEIGNDGFLRTVFGLSSGRMKNGWAVSLAGSYKQGDGWVDGNFTKGWFYYFRIDKQLGKHLLSAQGYGAPQRHGQRSFKTSIATVDTVYAKNLGITSGEVATPGNYLGLNRGRKFNQHWGYYEGDVFNTNTNYYHKPQFSLRHSWQPNRRVFWSNIAYLSLGNGGGTSPEGPGLQSYVLDSGQIGLDSIANYNQSGTFLKPEGLSELVIRSSVNNHFWVGGLSTFKYDFTENLSFSTGLDGRYYRGDHFRKVDNLLSGDYFFGGGNTRVAQPDTLRRDDKFDYDNSGFVRWIGAFGLAEWKKNNWTVFLNASVANSGYRLEDYMKPKVVELSDTTLYVTYSKKATHNGTTYTLDSPEAKNQKLEWVNIPSFTLKTGASYKIGKQHSVFLNAGYLSRAQRFNNVIRDYRNDPNTPIGVFSNYENEKIQALEGGYSFASPVFSANLNFYRTSWKNKPLDSGVTVASPVNPDERIPVNITGIDALHQGVELDFAWKLMKNLTLEGLASIGDWRWTSDTAKVFVEDFDLNYQFDFDAKGVHVGDAAQLQFGGSLRYEPVKRLYVKIRGIWFGKNFADFQPETLRGANAGRDSWQMPDYAIFDAHLGYGFKLWKSDVDLRLNILNILDEVYISDATNNDSFAPGINTADFDAKSAAVHFGPGRTWNASLQFSF